MPLKNPQPGEEFEDKHGTIYRIVSIVGSVVKYERKLDGTIRFYPRSCPLSGWPSLAERLSVKEKEVRR